MIEIMLGLFLMVVIPERKNNQGRILPLYGIDSSEEENEQFIEEFLDD